MTSVPLAPDDITLTDDDPRGYRRSPALQAQFTAAAASLLATDPWHLADGTAPPGPPELRCDLALEGGGVKGIGLVGAILVLDEAGYRIQRVAGTSAGAIAATLIAGLVHRGRPLTELRRSLGALEFGKFMPEGPVHRFLDHFGHTFADVASDVAVLAHRMGLYSGAYLYEWLTPILDDLGVSTFADLRLTAADDPEMSLPPERQYRLVVHASDVTRRQLVRLPWDLGYYGHDPSAMAVADAVRASMSIPFFFEPFRFEAADAVVPTPVAGGETVAEHNAAGTVTWVDGGMLRNFPITAFDRIDGRPARWPTIGIKLSAMQTEFPATAASEHTLDLGLACLHTVLNEWDRYGVEEATAARTIFVDSAGLKATDFHLTAEQQGELFRNGVAAATQFVIEMGQLGHMPSAAEATQLAALRRQITAEAQRSA